MSHTLPTFHKLLISSLLLGLPTIPNTVAIAKASIVSSMAQPFPYPPGGGVSDVHGDEQGGTGNSLLERWGGEEQVISRALVKRHLVRFLEEPVIQELASLSAPSHHKVDTSPLSLSVDQKLLGLWRAKNISLGLAKLTLIFTPDDKLFLLLPSTSGTSIAYEARYHINQNSQPMQIDVSSPNDEQTSREIFEFTADGKLRIEVTIPGRPRPTAFTRRAVLFEKISEATALPANTQILKPDLAEDRTRQSEGKSYIGSLNRAQQAYYLENNKFATTIEQLGVDIKPETENYRYQIVSQPNRLPSVFMTASAKHPELRSYTGAVFIINFQGETTSVQGTCETDSSSPTPPAMPMPSINPEGRVQCPSGSHPLLRGLHE